MPTKVHLVKAVVFPVVMYGCEGLTIKTGEQRRIDVFLELSCFFDDPVNVGNLISGSSSFSESRLDIWKFLVHIMLKPRV